MEAEFIPYKLALALKELGFDEPCFSFYINADRFEPFSLDQKWLDYNLNSRRISAPLYQQAFRWFREKYRLDLLIAKDDIEQYYFSVKKSEALFDEDDYCFETYEKAELECLKKLIEIVKEK